jgi:hypothetical protein
MRRPDPNARHDHATYADGCEVAATLQEASSVEQAELLEELERMHRAIGASITAIRAAIHPRPG